MAKKRKPKITIERSSASSQTATEWTVVLFPQVVDFFEQHPSQQHRQAQFAADVTENPFSHPNPKRIKRLDQYPGKPYRWGTGGRNAIRIAYHPEKLQSTVYALFAAKRGDFYKKKNRARMTFKK